jgi:hypothetical protein
LRSTRRARRAGGLAALALAALIGGCATGTGGGAAFDLLNKGSGDYVLSAAEMHWNCAGLENALQARITRISALSQQAKADENAMPPTLSRFMTRLAGEPDSPALVQIKSERAAADAYNRELKTKGCPAVDMDARLASAAAVVPVVAAPSAPAVLEPPPVQGLHGKL